MQNSPLVFAEFASGGDALQPEKSKCDRIQYSK